MKPSTKDNWRTLALAFAAYIIIGSILFKLLEKNLPHGNYVDYLHRPVLPYSAGPKSDSLEVHDKK